MQQKARTSIIFEEKILQLKRSSNSEIICASPPKNRASLDYFLTEAEKKNTETNYL